MGMEFSQNQESTKETLIVHIWMVGDHNVVSCKFKQPITLIDKGCWQWGVKLCDALYIWVKRSKASNLPKFIYHTIYIPPFAIKPAWP